MSKRLILGVMAPAILYATVAHAEPTRGDDSVRETASALAPATDARWTAWLGCWRPEVAAGEEARTHVICVLPAPNDGVVIATIADGAIVSEQALTADGSRRAVDKEGCKGFETAKWSADGRRVFLKSELTCGADVKRTSTGVLALVSAGSYVDVQSVEVAGQHAARTVRYVAIEDGQAPSVVAGRLPREQLARETARMSAAAPLTMEAVVEASGELSNQAVDGLLVARRVGFDLNADRLRQLVKAGVNTSTIDVMVALTYPKQFEVAEEVPAAVMNGYDGVEPMRPRQFGLDSCYDRFGYGYDRLRGDYSYDRDRYGYGYSPYRNDFNRCGSFYSPFGYDSYGWRNGTGTVVIVQPTVQQQGAAVKGKGYTRRGESTGTAKPRSTPATTSTARPASATGSVKGGGNGAGSGAAPAKSGTDTGRTAKPRGGN